MKFCPRCFKRMSERWAKKVNYDPKHKLNVKKMVFPCQVPIYEPNHFGEPMVRIWNCRTERFDIYALKDYNKKKSRGEI